MAKRKTSKRGGVLWIVVLILLVLLGGVVFNATNGFTTELKNFAVIYNEEYILNNETELFIKEGEQFEIKQYSDSEEIISVQIFTLESKKEGLTYSFAGREFEWNETAANQDVTSCFNIQITQPTDGANGTIKISGNLMNVLNYISDGREVTLGDNFSIENDLFRMAIKVGDDIITLDFSVEMEPVGFYFDKNGLVF